MTVSLMFDRVRWLCTVLICMVLAACATPPVTPGTTSDTSFDRSGRFALSVVYTDGKQEAVQGGFSWHDTGAMLMLDLANPLGNTLARVQVEPGRATLIRSDGSTERASHPDALVEQVLGSPIPVAGLRDWLQGDTGSDTLLDLQTNPQGKPASFTQNGWRVQLSRYDAMGPALLQLNRNDANRTISMRLVVDGG